MYIADLHIHSRYSIATSKQGDPEHLDQWARRKGISIVGTGDLTHPAWRAELKEKLVPAEPGFYVLKDEYRLDDGTNNSFQPRFVLTGEISSIYKKNDKTRKVHSLILLPDLEAADELAAKLEIIGNIHSDGRPILGLDCHDLLAITLDTSDRAIYVPAHIWTPHFSVFGAFSGFDTLQECYEDLTPYIHALETGLSSDPPMNWLWSALDSYQLISNSDAHSPAKLGREANLLDIQLGYAGLYEAIQTGRGLVKTLEFYPEEGKYHYDGHRKCNVCLSPEEAEVYDGICPVCGKKLTMGVYHRIRQLADRPDGYMPPKAKPFESLVPLPEIIASTMGVATASVKVQHQYQLMLKQLGPEFEILRELPLEVIENQSGSLMAEAIRRLRNNVVHKQPGYDGEYGKISIFNETELQRFSGQFSLFSNESFDEISAEKVKPNQDTEQLDRIMPQAVISNKAKASKYNTEQLQAITTEKSIVAVIAGPGTGKTRTLVARVETLIKVRKISPSEITCVTFTRKAAAEMRARISTDINDETLLKQLNIGTFHALCKNIIERETTGCKLADTSELYELAQAVIKQYALPLTPKSFMNAVSVHKNHGSVNDEPNFLMAVDTYRETMDEAHLIDYDDLLLKTLQLLNDENTAQTIRKAFSYLLVDEFQDISPLQYELIKAWNADGQELFVIGDPDQSIYAFRGADGNCFQLLHDDYPAAEVIRLKTNYRSANAIIKAATAVINHNPGAERILLATRNSDTKLREVHTVSVMAQDIYIAKQINQLVGGIDMLSAKVTNPHIHSFGDIAILYRTHHQEALIETCLIKEGIPYVVIGKQDLIDDPQVRGTVCFFRYLFDCNDPRNLNDFKRLFNLDETSSIFHPTTELITKYTNMIKKVKPQDVLLEWGKEMGLSANAAFDKLTKTAVFHHDIPDLLDTISYGKESDQKRYGGKQYNADAVSLMTLHAAKGLEFPVVMICGLDEGLIPMTADHTNIEEERRLFYVGMTRARDELILITAAPPSRFLNDIPTSVTITEDAGRQGLKKEQQLSLF